MKNLNSPVEIKGGMEWYVGVLLGLLFGTFGYFLGQKMQPKSQLWTNLRKDYETVINDQRAQIKQFRSSMNWYKRGQIPTTLKGESDPEKLIEGIIAGLPERYKLLIGPLKGEILNLAKENPELMQYAPGLIEKFLTSKGEQAAEETSYL